MAEGTLFIYFKGKDELINQLYLDIKQGLAEAILADYPHGGSLRKRTKHIWKRYVNSRRTDFDFPLVDKERAWNIIDVMKGIASELNCTVAQVALAWLLARPVVSSVIIGARNLQQLDDNCGAVEVTLSQQHMDALNKVSALPPEYPGWMVPFQSLDRLNPKVDRFKALQEHTLATAK